MIKSSNLKPFGIMPASYRRKTAARKTFSKKPKVYPLSGRIGTASRNYMVVRKNTKYNNVVQPSTYTQPLKRKNLRQPTSSEAKQSWTKRLKQGTENVLNTINHYQKVAQKALPENKRQAAIKGLRSAWTLVNAFDGNKQGLLNHSNMRQAAMLMDMMDDIAMPNTQRHFIPLEN